MTTAEERTLDTDTRVGTTIAGYRIERVLGRGGMSTVYLAEDLALRRRVALKFLSPELSMDPRFRERFRFESRLAASIDHPNVIPIYEAGQEDDGTLFIAMRYVEGADLKTLLRAEGALDPRQAVEILGQAARGLDAAHETGLVHRDVKPSNVLIARGKRDEDHVYLADFGLTKTATSPEDAKESITLSGSADYVSPEQIRDGSSDNASDVYAFGCLAYECLTGEVPFPGRGEMEVLWAHMNDEPPAPSSVNLELPDALNAVTAKAMAKEPADRYQSGSELVDAIEEATTLPARRLGKRSIALLAGLLAVIVAAAVIAAVLLSGGGGGSAAPDPENSTIETIAGTGEAGYSGDGRPATEAQLSDIEDIVFDSAGNLYFSDFAGGVRRIDEEGIITTIAGEGSLETGDDGLAVDAHLTPGALGVDAAGNLFVADRATNTVRRISPDGVIITIAGGGDRSGYAADSGLATETQLNVPWIDVDAAGTLYIADERHNRILKVDPSGRYTTIAGNGQPSIFGDGGPASEARVAWPIRLAVAPDGSLYFGDGTGHRLRRIDPDGIITTIAGTETRGFSGDGGPAAAAKITSVGGIAVDPRGNVYFSDSDHETDVGHRIRRIDGDGVIATVAGTGEAGFRGDGGPATNGELHSPLGIALDPDGNLYILDNRNHRIRKVTFEAN